MKTILERISAVRQSLKPILRRLASPFRRSFSRALHGAGRHFCPVCERNVRRFLPCGAPLRANAVCPLCGSLERHRLDWLFLSQQTDLLDGSQKTLLHVAPEQSLEARFRCVENLDYLSADLDSPRAMVQMDLTGIQYPDNSFSAIYCSHVLEHIQDDRRAIAEMYRVLSSSGWALLQVPITASATYEDPSIKDPEGRKKHFGQSDHVRRCGPDYIERFRAAGFVALVFRATDLVSESDCVKMGFQPDRLIFFCTKP